LQQGIKLKHERPEQAFRLQRLEGLAPDAPSRPFRGRLAALTRARLWFVGVVVIPTLAALLYYGLIASDMYVAEARFVVRTSSQPSGLSSFGALLQNAGFSRSTDDTFSVHDFIQSRDIVAELAHKTDLVALLSRPGGDIFRRYPPVWGRRNFEQLYESYNTFVHVEFDTSTGISTLAVEAFRPEDSVRLARAILGSSESLINRMNDRARQDTVAMAEGDVRRAEKREADAQVAITAYRLRTRDLDPRAQARASYTLAGQLSLQVANARAQLRQMEAASPASPQLPPLRASVSALEAQLTRANAELTGRDNSTTVQLSQFERLQLEQDFATKALASATVSLETARQNAARQQLYLEEIVTPQLPDYPIHPRRLVGTLLVFTVSLLIYGIGWLIGASLREHAGR
jgi:capsular polysaccharide transport system permease protein